MLIGIVYLFGSPVHVYFALFNAEGYRGMSDWAPPITAASERFWFSWFLPNARYFGLLIAVVELSIAVLILSRGLPTSLGLAAATAFHLALTAIFGMWPYTVPMVLLLSYAARFEFSPGPTARLVGSYGNRTRR